MNKFTREYYSISKAAELLGCELDELLHKGACGILPIYVMPKEWWGFIFDQTYTKGRNTSYGRTPERTLLRDLAEGRLWAGTVQFFEDGEEEVTVKSIWYPPNPETGKIRQVDLDIPVVFKKTQLYVFTKDIENLSFETTSQNEEGLNKKRPRPQSASATEPPPPDLEIEVPKITPSLTPVETTATSGDHEDRYMTMKEVCKFLKTSRSTIDDAVKKGRFPKKLHPFGGRAVLFERSEIIARMHAGHTNSRPDDATPKAVPQMRRNQEAQDHEEIKPASAVPASAENKPIIGLVKHDIALAFDGIVWTYVQWIGNLETPPIYLKNEHAIVVQGKKGKGHSTIWNPAVIAFNMLEHVKDIKMNFELKMKFNAAFKNHPKLLPWSAEWKQYL